MVFGGLGYAFLEEVPVLWGKGFGGIADAACVDVENKFLAKEGILVGQHEFLSGCGFACSPPCTIFVLVLWGPLWRCWFPLEVGVEL